MQLTIRMNIIKQFLHKRLLAPLLLLLKQGITPEKLALSVGLGVSLGIFPMIGSTTLLCVIFGFLFRVNQPAIQLINYFTAPLQLILFIPFFQMGAFIFHSDPFPFSVQEIFSMLSTDAWSAIRSLWSANLQAVAAWILVGPLLSFTIYRILVRIFTRIASREISP